MKIMFWKIKLLVLKNLKKGKYNIPWNIVGVSGVTEYIVEFPIDIKNLRKIFIIMLIII